ncbi:hypothetical protein P4S72_20000 [Vibrio sp. PP-XX7]
MADEYLDYTVASYSDINDLTKNNCVAADSSTVNELRYYDRPSGRHSLVTPMKGLLCAARTIYTKQSALRFFYRSGYTDTTLAANWVSGRAKDGSISEWSYWQKPWTGDWGSARNPRTVYRRWSCGPSDLGENRIVAAMHSPLDVIGGRITGLAVTGGSPKMTLTIVQLQRQRQESRQRPTLRAQMAGQYRNARCALCALHNRCRKPM